ncbi:hypothetical protein ACP70R_005485 [Stipagrostis hirtigluma subsp. patula]
MKLTLEKPEPGQKGPYGGPDHYGWLDWRCNSTDEFCSRLGPFDTAATTGRAFTRSAIAVQDTRCEPMGDAAAARVSAVFRAMTPSEHHRTAARRTGLGGTTLSAEGVWRASTGRLCMVGCLGIGEEASCNYRVSLHVATTFSITRRGRVVGEIISTEGGSSPPLVFQDIVSPGQPSNKFGPSGKSVPLVYRYTKVKQAGELLRRREPSGFRDSFIARSLLSYPTVAGAADGMTSLSDLAQDLSLQFHCVPKLPFFPYWMEDPVLHFVPRIVSNETLVHTKHQVLNVWADDPMYFNGTELRSPPIDYREQREMLKEHTIEKLLRVAMLSAAIAATASQLRYIKAHPDVAPYVSLAMLGVQALGYCVTLVTDAEMLPVWPESDSGGRSYTGELRWDMDSSVKALTLAALLLTARLTQKVRRARARARARSPLEPGRVPSDTAVLLCTLGVHLGVLFFVLAMTGAPMRRPPSRMATRGAVAERYLGVVKEWFLIPQVIGNALWGVNCKPLRPRYYAGVSAVWLLPHAYGYLRPTAVVNMYAQIQDDVMDFYAKACDVVVPVIVVVLALAVYVQQRRNYIIVAWPMMKKQNKLQHVY